MAIRVRGWGDNRHNAIQSLFSELLTLSPISNIISFVYKGSYVYFSTIQDHNSTGIIKDKNDCISWMVYSALELWMSNFLFCPLVGNTPFPTIQVHGVNITEILPIG